MKRIFSIPLFTFHTERMWKAAMLKHLASMKGHVPVSDSTQEPLSTASFTLTEATPATVTRDHSSSDPEDEVPLRARMKRLRAKRPSPATVIPLAVLPPEPSPTPRSEVNPAPAYASSKTHPASLRNARLTSLAQGERGPAQQLSLLNLLEDTSAMLMQVWTRHKELAFRVPRLAEAHKASMAREAEARSKNSKLLKELADMKLALELAEAARQVIEKSAAEEQTRLTEENARLKAEMAAYQGGEEDRWNTRKAEFLASLELNDMPGSRAALFFERGFVGAVEQFRAQDYRVPTVRSF
ncbi:uncharacterized protein LOC122004093 isoform X2 [Zingiber officinale]|uniref:uncharacterized protein LOC122004093 isoform X2 n=1 Tax=Zingiber officinale TaxID=94328 RepID=UPI001C4DA0D9|nr:uncharacterized protein LOC122004093 isoform X2 [Zingiber officinale]